MLTPALGARIQYIKTHEGHLGRVTGVVHNKKGKLVKVGMRCDCGSNLWLNPRDFRWVKE